MKKKLNIYTCLALAFGFSIGKLVEAHYWDALIAFPVIFGVTYITLNLWQTSSASKQKLKR